ncbi:hypothetical protein ACFWTC_03275 [Streptomyces sp. NPDC058619]|uniref:hypothetical protein n=1 Tax=unclassified Streptomyces TaxID=2593676 RepID=UPI00364D5D2F
MSKTGPQKYPPASLAYWWQGAFPGNPMESNVGVLHTTEGRTLPDYRGGRDAPNFTALPDIPNKRLRWYQHFDFDTSSRALMNLAGGVETNTANAVQIELVGTCDERKAVTWDGKRAGVDYIFWPAAPDWVLAELAIFVRWASEAHNLLMQSGVTWKPYKKGQVGGSYGANGVRLTGTQWGDYYGWLGHQHVPENDHGDPGDIDFARVLALARGEQPEEPTNSNPTEEEDPMAGLTKEDIAHATLYWLNQAMSEKPESAGTHPLAGVVASLNTKFKAQNAILAALPAACKLTPTEIAAALADGTLKVQITVAPATTPKES